MSAVTRTGVDNPWRDESNDPEPIEVWLGAGFGREEAESWRGWRFTLSEAHAWRRAGVVEALHAAQWSTARATPDNVSEWQAADIDATEAVRWHEFGFDVATAKREKARGHGPTDAFQRDVQSSFSVAGFAGRGSGPIRRFMAAGIPGPILQSYMARQWFDDEAFDWAHEHVDASDAQLWKELGVRPQEAGRANRRGLTAIGVVREWWKAGIPLDEVADWLGAGLTADEAALQRSKGITAEQAAALRALRDTPDE